MKAIFLKLMLIGFLCLSSSCSSVQKTPPATAYLNAVIWTGNPNQPTAQAILARGNTIADVGSNDDILSQLNLEDTAYDTRGAMIVPGFIDAHVHFITGGFRLSSVQLRDAVSQEMFIERIEAFAKTLAPGEWILGGDWDHEQWGGELPTRAWIDDVTPLNPVWVNRLDGHMALANTAALEAASVQPDVADVFGGEIVRDVSGSPTGIFKDNAMSLVGPFVPDPSAAQTDRALDAAMAYVNEQGVTSVHHVGGFEQLDVFERTNAEGRLKTRVYAATPLHEWEKLRDKMQLENQSDNWFRIGALKGFVDGSLGSHTAAFFEPFSDAPGDSGLYVNTPEDLYSWISGADAAGLQVAVHAIGDRSINMLLNTYERVAEENGLRDRRFRIEHAQHIAPADIPRFASLDVIASMQPYHAIDDGRWAERVIGPERIKTTYAFRSLLDAGARVAFGSDWFVAPPTPLEGIYAAVTRRTLDDANPDGWVPEQKITVDEALRAYTLNAAYAAYEEDTKGSLEPGKLADFVLIDRDLTAIPPHEIRNARILQTVVDGRPVYTDSLYTISEFTR